MVDTNKKNILGVIPARGGSKGVKKKNIRMVGGKPLISYTIESLRQCSMVDNFITSTDSDEIASVAESYGCRVVKRPPELAKDETPTVPVIAHALSVLERETSFDYVAVLQPTTPLRSAEDIDLSLQNLIQSGVDSTVTVYKVEDHHPARMYRLVQNRLIPFAEEPVDRQRHSLSEVYHRNGAVYACKRTLINRGVLYEDDILPYVMPKERSVNIDDELDLAFTDFLFKSKL